MVRSLDMAQRVRDRIARELAAAERELARSKRAAGIKTRRRDVAHRDAARGAALERRETVSPVWRPALDPSREDRP